MTTASGGGQDGRRARRIAPVAAIVTMLAACAGAPTEAPKPAVAEPTAAPLAPASAAPATASAPKSDPASDELVIPTECAPGSADGVCAVPPAFVSRLCDRFPMPDVALRLFAKDSPYTRAYINRNVEAWYTSGSSGTRAQLVFDEEVLVLRHPKDSGGGIVVNGGGSPYDVLRWDGVCASLGGEEVTLKRPPSPKRPLIPWQHLEENVKDALLADATIAKAEATRRKECKGTTSLGMQSAACAKADDKLSATIVDWVAKGGQVPLPKKPR
jgi:hypothetical protein